VAVSLESSVPQGNCAHQHWTPRSTWIMPAAGCGIATRSAAGHRPVRRHSLRAWAGRRTRPVKVSSARG